jgi:hypothetical protein
LPSSPCRPCALRLAQQHCPGSDAVAAGLNIAAFNAGTAAADAGRADPVASACPASPSAALARCWPCCCCASSRETRRPL